ncbi:MAG: 6-phosphogluconolactonase [Bacteroidota bacterium]
MIHIYNKVEEVLEGVAEYIVSLATKSIDAQGSFTIALSGGSSPKKLYSLLANEPYKSQVAWDKVFFFFGDERYVPANNPASNYQMVKKVLFEPLEIGEHQVFAVDTTLQPAQSAAQYMNAITGYFKDADTIFDLVLLGLGDNSHTASLFPFTPVLHEQLPTIKEVFIPDQQVYRITFTAALINKASNVAFLVYGESKAQAVYNILEEERDIDTYPAQLIEPLYGDPEWYLDEAAAKKIRV